MTITKLMVSMFLWVFNTPSTADGSACAGQELARAGGRRSLRWAGSHSDCGQWPPRAGPEASQNDHWPAAPPTPRLIRPPPAFPPPVHHSPSVLQTYSSLTISQSLAADHWATPRTCSLPLPRPLYAPLCVTVASTANNIPFPSSTSSCCSTCPCLNRHQYDCHLSLAGKVKI